MPKTKATKPTTNALPPAIRKDKEALLKRMEGLHITSQESHALAEDWLLWNKRVQLSVKGHYDSQIEPLDKQIKPLRAARKAALDPLVQGEDTIKRQILDWDRAEQARLEAEARALTEKRNKVELRKLTRSGLSKTEAAEEVEALPPVLSAGTLERNSNVIVAQKWEAEVEVLKDLVLWALENWDERGIYILPNTTVLNANARSMKDPTKAPPGVRYVDVGQIRARKEYR